MITPSIDNLKLNEELGFWHVPGAAVAISLDGENVISTGVGVIGPVEMEEVDEDTLFCIASCTKSYTATLALLLSKEGLIDFDIPVKKYLPELVLKDKLVQEGLTLRDMLMHVSGLPGHDFLWPYYDISDEEFIKRLSDLDFNESLRGKAQYNNIMYILAGIIEERVTGRKWGELIEEYLFGPIGMENSYLSIEEANKYEPDRIAKGFLYKDGEYTELKSIAPKERASGSLVMSIGDMMKWLKFQMDGRLADGRILLSKEELDFLHNPQVIYGHKEHAFEKDSLPILYAYGWFVREYRGMQIVYHHGGTLGYNSLQAIIPEKKMAIAVLINSHGVAEMFTDAVMYTAIDMLIFDEDTGEFWRNSFHGDAEMTNHFIDRSIGIDAVYDGECMYQVGGKYINSSYGTISIEKASGDYMFRYKDFLVPLLYIGKKDRKSIFIVEGLVADTEFYRLPVEFDPDAETMSIPFEGKTASIVFSKTA